MVSTVDGYKFFTKLLFSIRSKVISYATKCNYMQSTVDTNKKVVSYTRQQCTIMSILLNYFRIKNPPFELIGTFLVYLLLGQTEKVFSIQKLHIARESSPWVSSSLICQIMVGIFGNAIWRAKRLTILMNVIISIMHDWFVISSLYSYIFPL